VVKLAAISSVVNWIFYKAAYRLHIFIAHDVQKYIR
jgi:hypothetical protein